MTLEPAKTNNEIPQQDGHALKAEDVLKHLEVHENGLTSEEAKQGLAHYGENQLNESPRPGFLAMLWEQLINFVVILLIIASVISACWVIMWKPSPSWRSWCSTPFLVSCRNNAQKKRSPRSNVLPRPMRKCSAMDIAKRCQPVN